MSQNNTHQSHAAPAARPSQPIRHLTQIAQRWRISPRTLERWRWLGQGPRYLKIGGRVVYRLEDVEAFEDEKRQEAGR
ncbi:AlpA family transcriptional regulator [Elioraea sp.]|uniref:helix-turn-helix transcriptional regulator n=1 Tax=Elioraea sp. TaxID=2185103 RepID=UPI0021DDEAC4|nr:helix-turn-helix domain-containing protein [Elioraea sp.]GIX11795.1 MAG: hypothetical protein KatS3mg116_3505 [Elioraea sp.]